MGTHYPLPHSHGAPRLVLLETAPHAHVTLNTSRRTHLVLCSSRLLCRTHFKFVYDRSVAFEPTPSKKVASRPEEGVTLRVESRSTAVAVDSGSRSSSVNSDDTPPIFLWVRQREGDAIFLLPEGSAKQDGAPVSTASESGVVITLPPGEEEEEQGPWGWEGDMEEGKRETGQDREHVGMSRTAQAAYDMRSDLQGHAGEALWSFAAERCVRSCF